MDAMTLASTAVALLAGDPATDAADDHCRRRSDTVRTNQPRRRCSIRDAVRRAFDDADEGDVLIDLTDAPTDVSRLLDLAQALRVRVEDDSALREELDRLVGTVLRAPASALSGSWHFAYLLQDYADSSRLAGRWDEALLAYEQSRAIMIELGDLAGAARGLNNLGTAHEDRGELAQAAQCFASLHRGLHRARRCPSRRADIDQPRERPPPPGLLGRGRAMLRARRGPAHCPR